MPPRDDDYVRRLIEMEVAAQLRPLEKALAEITHRFKSFYRNGDKDTAKGTFDLRLEVDDQRHADILAIQKEQNQKLDKLVEAKNLSDGQKQGENDVKKDSRANNTLMVGVLALILSCILALCSLLVWARSGKPLSEVIPSEWQEKIMDSPPTKVYAHEQEPPPQHSIQHPPPELR